MLNEISTWNKEDHQNGNLTYKNNKTWMKHNKKIRIKNWGIKIKPNEKSKNKWDDGSKAIKYIKNKSNQPKLMILLVLLFIYSFISWIEWIWIEFNVKLFVNSECQNDCE